MPNVITIFKHITADAEEEDDYTLYEVKSAKRLKLTRVRVSFPAGTYHELSVSLKRGLEQIWPVGDGITGDNEVIYDNIDEEIESGSRLILHYKNSNTTQEREVTVMVTGVLE